MSNDADDKNQKQEKSAKQDPLPKQEPPQKEPDPKHEPSAKEEPDQKNESLKKTGSTRKPEPPFKQSNKFDRSSIGDSQVAMGKNIKQETINNIINNWGLKNFEISSFSVEGDSYILSKEDINSVEQIIIYPSDQMDKWICYLREHRLLLLTGEAGSGKYLTAKYLCFRVMQENHPNYEVRFFEPLAAKTDIELSKMINNEKALKQKILIFKNIFAKNNQNIVDFLDSLSKNPLDSILKELDAFILLTADTGTFDKYHLANLKITRDMFQLDHDLLKKGFDKKLKNFCSLSPKRDFTRESQLFESKKNEIINKLGCMSKISSFIENFLDKIIFEEKSIDEAIEEVIDIRKHLEHWLLKELGMNEKEFETWTFALCLAMFNGCTYSTFKEIHTKITILLLRKFDPFKTLKGFYFTLSERELLENCKAEIIRESEKEWGFSSDRIKFCDPRYPKILLEIFLHNNRKILLSLIPFLERYIESHDSIEQKRAAAICLARIGVMEPETITFPVIAKWASMENSNRKNVGYLYEGIFESKDKEYKQYCMRILKAMALSNDSDLKRMAISAYKQIGLHDLEFALDELRKIQEDAIERMSKKQEEKIMDFLYSEIESLNEQDLLTKISRIYKETDDLLDYIRESIVNLSISIILDPICIEPIDVINGLRKWIHNGNRNSRANVVVVFMGTEGIINKLEDYAIILSDKNELEKKGELSVNLLSYALSAGEEPVKKMASFLNDLVKKCFSEFPTDVKKELKILLFDHFKNWTLGNLSDDKISDAIKKLIIRFYKYSDDELKDILWDTINKWKVPKDKIDMLEDKLDAFIDDISRQIFNI